MGRRVATLLVAALVWLRPAAAFADIGDYLAKPITSVRVESRARPITDGRILGLIETRSGQPLLIADIRASITHVFSLGQYEDVRVHATAEAAGVALLYELVPLRTIAGMAFTGDRVEGFDQSRIRGLITERFGASPLPARIPEIEALVVDEMRAIGYLRAAVTSRIESDRGGARSVLVLVLAPGERTRIGTIDVEGEPGMPIPQLVDVLRLSRGAPFQTDVLNARIDRYLDERKRHGYFAARMSFSPQLIDTDRTANLTLTVVPGPHVTVEFAGDPLPGDRHDDLVPVAREGSADEDILEDASNRIEDLLRSQGYRDAIAPHTREEREGELVITFTVRRGPQYRVGRVDFAGNASIPLADLQQHLLIRPGQPFSEAAINADRAIVEDFYRRAGFAAVQTQVTTESEPAVGGAVEIPVAIRIGITENVRTIVTSVRIDGSLSVSESDLRPGLTLQVGQPFSVNALAVDRDTMQLRLANLGYQAATVVTNPGTGADGRSADVVFTVREGQRIAVDHVLIVGNQRTRTATIERELQFKSGEPLGLEQVNESQRRLAALGLFRRVRVTELSHGDESRRDVLVSVDEAPVTTIGYGGGVEAGQRLRTEEDTGVASENLEVAPRAFFEVGRRNLLGKNRSINLFSSVSLHLQNAGSPATSSSNLTEYRVLGTYREPRLLDSSADGLATAGLEQQIRSSFSFHRVGVTGLVVQRLTPALSLTPSYQIQRTELLGVNVTEANQGSLAPLIARLFSTEPLRLSSFSALLIHDKRDDAVSPTLGHYVSVNGQLAALAIGSQVGFAKSFITAQEFRTIPRSKGIVLAGNARLGVAREFDTDNPIPEPERFFAGGDTTVRGFALDTLGVRHDPIDPQRDTIDKNGFPIGGNATVILMGEARVPVHGSLSVVGFFDTGNVFQRLNQVNVTELRSAVGLGVRYKSPFGPMRFDLGFKTHVEAIPCQAGADSPNQCFESRPAIHISFGQAF
jgi:outer membrane protein insertion porin family